MALQPTYPLSAGRLHLRPLNEADVEALVSYYSRPSTCRYLPVGPFDSDAVVARLRLGPWSRSTLDEEGDILGLGVELISTATLIGDVMLRWTSERDRSGEIGWVLHPDHVGRGYATEAAQAVLGLAFGELELHRVIARIDARNTPSILVAERLGMRREAHLVENHWKDDEWSSEVDYAVLRREWLPQPGSE